MFLEKSKPDLFLKKPNLTWTWRRLDRTSYGEPEPILFRTFN